jgi:hypothetical protein
MKLFWVYRPVNMHLPKGASDWFQKDMSVAGELVVIRDQLIPMLAAAELLGSAEGQRPAFDLYARGRLLTFKEYVSSYWNPTKVAMGAEANMQTLMGRLNVLVSSYDSRIVDARI